MDRGNILSEWFFWHFIDVPKKILNAWGNFLKFFLNYFSVFLLLKTLFFPWKRYRWTVAARGLDVGEWIEVRISNAISRSIGAIVRIATIFIAIGVEVFVLFLGILIFIGWFLLPIFLILGLYYGFIILF